MANSTNVADSQTIVAIQYNNLRLDVFDTSTGHDHDGTANGGKKVAHSDLITPGSNSHTVIDAHIAAASAHGLDAAVDVAGSGNTSQLVFIAGTYSPSPDIVDGSKTVYFSDDGLSPAENTLTTVITVILTPYGNSGDGTHDADIVRWMSASAGAGTFVYAVDHSGGTKSAGLGFIVVGTK